VEEAVRIAREVADALAYAHGHGVVHRDIKPENILLHGGHAQVADFGIALAVSRSEGGTRMTETGMSLGTPHYMAPEQAMGEREITPKADIYALGCVLYEMLCGEPPFMGPTAQAIIARVMTEQPRSITMQRRTVPPHIEAAVSTALEKLPADRFASAAEFGAALTESGAPGYRGTAARTQASATARPPVRPYARLIVAALALLAAGALVGAKLLAPAAVVRPVRLSITLPGEAPPIAVRLSPDGSTLAYIAGRGDRLAVYTRRLDDLDAHQVSGTEDASTVSFSPDGQWIAFVVGNQARKVPVGGGSAVAIPVGERGVAQVEWTASNEFLVATGDGNLARLAGDGAVAVFARPDTAHGEALLVLDQVLPDGWALARPWRAPPNGPVIAVDPSSGRRVMLVDANVAWAGYADGMLAWALPDGSLYVAPCDIKGKKLTGPGLPIGGTVLSVLGFVPPVAISHGGMVYAPTRPRALVRVARSGLATVLLATDRTYHNPRVSPDGRKISLDFTDQVRDVWLFDIADSTLTRFGFDSTAHDAVWTPDGRSLLFGAVRGANIGVFRRRLDSGSPAESVLVNGQQLTAHTVAPDGRIAIAVGINGGAFDLVSVALDGSHREDTVLATRYNEGWPALSRDGHWLAYQSDESGRMEVYVRSYPAMGSKFQVSQNGGSEPIWSPDGRELFFRSGGAAEPWLVSAAIEFGASPRVRSRETLFSMASYEFATPHPDYDVFPDGRSFVMVRQGRPGQTSEVVYLQNLQGLTARHGGP